MFLVDAPNVLDTMDIAQCGDLREYLGFDAGFADDDQICEETKRLECSDDIFAALNGFSGGGGPQYEPVTESTQINTVSSGKCAR